MSRKIARPILDKIIDTFKIRVDITEPVEDIGLRREARLYKVKKLSNSEIYILDSPEIMKVACHPHIVGIELEELMETIANDASKILIELTSIKNLDSDEIIFEHILRAAPGYCLHKALRRNNLDFREVWIRPRYKLPSYRDHDEEDVKEIEIVYQDFSQIPEGCELTVIKPDTEASGRTAEVSLKKLQEEVEKKNSRLRELIIYGFISEHALKIIEDKASKLGFKKIYFIALGNITSLCYNMYDMPLYGPDESYYSQYHEIRKLGGITDIEVLEEYLPEFIPGSDQPGDWSARQEKLYTGTEYESGRISNHLENSIRLIKRLWEISKDQEWFMEFHEEAIKKELEKLYQKLREYKP